MDKDSLRLGFFMESNLQSTSYRLNEAPVKSLKKGRVAVDQEIRLLKALVRIFRATESRCILEQICELILDMEQQGRRGRVPLTTALKLLSVWQ